ncbi:MAG: cyanophycinase [Flavobacteriales bacterium]|nr:cyanophycinase [Flavobacteriales bacterium]
MRTLFLLIFPHLLFAQGSLVLVGGGGESNGGWSDAPYTWGLNQSQNRKVAVIYYSSSTSWIPEYFMDLGAYDTARFDIDNLTLANSQATYDSLMQFDVFFIKGGNQWNYYNTWNNTKVEDAIRDKFNQGGVIMGTSAGMAILSEVIFTAENGSVYPDEALTNPYNNTDISLKDDFLNIFSDYIFDTHFVERGRFARLLVFMANWYQNAAQQRKDGVGVDDRTAICIDSNNIGVVMGSAAVTIIENNAWLNSHVSKDAKYIQLLNGNKYDFNSKQIVSGTNAINIYPTPITNPISYNNYINTLLISGSDSLEHMDKFLCELDSLHGQIQDTIYIYTCNTNRAGLLETKINNLNNPNTIVVDVTNGIILPSTYFSSGKKILFYENDWATLKDFLNNTTNGNILKSKLKDGVTITAFAGQNSKFVGTTFCSNIHDNIYGAYYGELEFEKGLNLIQRSVFIPNTFDKYTSSYYENTTSAIPWAMVKDTLAHGFYLSYDSYLLIKQTANKKAAYQREGRIILLTNEGTTADTATSFVYPSQNFLRQIVGFENFRIQCLNGDSLPIIEWSSITNPNNIIEQTTEKGKLLNITNILGERTRYKKNSPLIYIYNDGTIEKKIIIE